MLYSMARFRRDDAGVTLIEYGLIAAMIAIALVTALDTLGSNLSAVLNTVSTNV